MKRVNPLSTQVLDCLTKSLKEPGDEITIDNTEGASMPVHVKFITTTNRGPIFQVAHFYKQGGDLMSDPRMEFLKHENSYLPTCYEQHGGPFSYEVSLFTENGFWKINKKLQEKHADFSNLWLRNIKNQQRLKVRV